MGRLVSLLLAFMMLVLLLLSIEIHFAVNRCDHLQKLFDAGGLAHLQLPVLYPLR